MKGIIIIIVIIAAASIFSTSIIIPMSLVQAQPQASRVNQTGNNSSSYQIGPGALISPSFKPCKDNPGVLCSFYQKPPIPPPAPPPTPPNITMLPPPLIVLGPLPNLGKMPDNLFQQCMALHNGQEPPPSVFNASSKKIPAPYGTELPVCAMFPQFSQQPTNVSLPLTAILKIIQNNGNNNSFSGNTLYNPKLCILISSL